MAECVSFAVVRVLGGRSYIWHFLSDVGDTVQSSKTVERVYETGDETDHIGRPSSVVNPGSEDEFGVLVGWSFRCNHDHDDKPCDLKVEHLVY